jgi:hypothetical protein
VPFTKGRAQQRGKNNKKAVVFIGNTCAASDCPQISYNAGNEQAELVALAIAGLLLAS